ncbi:hypothetical protein [Segetibacter aerophilus]|uniref:Uncharacterized protein n=1 Tax=Segetibacter aerophilus TaxID=670293 RepID=A0A512B9X8_9BACT|nr:hypothetical protein [Segetibacter aerophilus]GEO08762.1 hypothetical protein SAE01_12580 [Segetibacter aerophilus]
MSDISTILKTIEGAVDKLSSHASEKQAGVFKKLVGMLKALETRQDAILNNTKNLKLINNIKVELERIIVDDRYKKEVKEFVSSYNDVQEVSNKYFSSFASNFSPKAALNAIRKTAVETTLNGLTETGIQAGVTEGMRKILLSNMTAGGSYADMTEQLRKYMLADENTPGALEQHVRTFSTTAINQYSAEYNKAVADDLGLEWYVYTGSLLTTSRPFCIKAVEKKYIHVSEFETILEGDFGEFGKVGISKSTGLPAGLMKGTDKGNLIRRRGGWACGHQMIAVAELIVPRAKKDSVYSSVDYKLWKIKTA